MHVIIPERSNSSESEQGRPCIDASWTVLGVHSSVTGSTLHLDHSSGVNTDGLYRGLMVLLNSRFKQQPSSSRSSIKRSLQLALHPSCDPVHSVAAEFTFTRCVMATLQYFPFEFRLHLSTSS